MQYDIIDKTGHRCVVDSAKEASAIIEEAKKVKSARFTMMVKTRPKDTRNGDLCKMPVTFTKPVATRKRETYKEGSKPKALPKNNAPFAHNKKSEAAQPILQLDGFSLIEGDK